MLLGLDAGESPKTPMRRSKAKLAVRHDSGWLGAIRYKAGLSDDRLQDQRHAFTSLGASGDSLLVIGALLDHRGAPAEGAQTYCA